MTKTLLTRIRKLEQYDTDKKTVLWEDPTESRWASVYGQLQSNDNAIFIGVDKLLIGEITKINPGQSILCSNIQEVMCSNDQLLQLHQIYPELISRVKANFQPFIHPLQVNIPQLIEDANKRRFVSYYIISGVTKYNELASTFKDNDRIVIINANNQLENVKLSSLAGLSNFPSPINVHINVEGLPLDEMLDKNRGIERKSARSNNVTRIINIKSAIEKAGIYKFKTFFSYHDSLFNKKVYVDGGDSEGPTRIIRLANETVYKVSMGIKEVKEEAFGFCNEHNLVIVHKNTKAKGTSSQTQADTFATQMKIGDYFYLCRGNNNLEVIGRITSDAEECEYESLGSEGWLQRSYDPVADAVNDSAYKGDKKWWTPNDNSTCIAIPNHEMNDANTKLFMPFFNTKFENEANLTPFFNTPTVMNPTLNNILFGPPGTGKTYTTINRALEIIGETTQGKTRQEIKDLFDNKMKEGQIVFTTFHQSMSYEDFIEGIKPNEPEQDGGPVIYSIKLGVFRTLCIEASFAIAQLREAKATKEVLDFSILYDNFAEDVQERIFNDTKVELEAKNGGSVMVESISEQGNFVIKHHNGTRTYTVSKARLTKLHSAISNLDDVSNIHDQFREIIGGSNSSAYWSVLNAIRKQKPIKAISNESRIYTIGEKKQVVASLLKADYMNTVRKPKPYVLIIDEINRGNVSQIFGELITLIEDDKRLGKEESLEVTLPYSKEIFGVPPNIHIIGTMNTADRSVEALDAALRRRFSFEEMPPNSSLIETDGKLKEQSGVLGNIELPLLLNTINRRIEKLLDKDHQIGHSYFMAVSDLKELKATFKNRIIPLLQEYFFGDYGKIGLVLGKEFFEQAETPEGNLFADFEEYDASVFAERTIYRIKDISNMTDANFSKAINILLKK